ncbi:MAG: UDP-glucose 6-dehydrogenase [Holosporales bacterium]
MKVTVVGTGYVGLVTGACLASLGHIVVCVDNNEHKIKDLNNGILPIYEPGLLEIVLKGVEEKRLSFTTNLMEAMQSVSVIMIAVGTPSTEDDVDMSYVDKSIKDIAQHLTPYQVIVTKSTVPVGTGDEICSIIGASRPDFERSKDFDVASNPEFLKEGSAVFDFMNPDRIVVGTSSKKAFDVLRKLYKPFTDKGYPLIETDIKSSELIKYTANCFLATKIAFMNEVSNFCESVGANIEDIKKGVGSDPRIGNLFLNPGPGYGGSCFPKDAVGLISSAKKKGTELSILKEVIASNTQRKTDLANRIVTYFKTNNLKSLAVLGITFKANTDDLRDASSLVIINELIKNSIDVTVYDPMYHQDNLPNGAHYPVFKDVVFKKNIEDATKGVDGLCILTEWDEFKTLDIPGLKKNMKSAIFIDYRNLYAVQKPNGFYYMCLGQKDVDLR